MGQESRKPAEECTAVTPTLDSILGEETQGCQGRGTQMHPLFQPLVPQGTVTALQAQAVPSPDPPQSPITHPDRGNLCSARSPLRQEALVPVPGPHLSPPMMRSKVRCLCSFPAWHHAAAPSPRNRSLHRSLPGPRGADTEAEGAASTTGTVWQSHPQQMQLLRVPGMSPTGEEGS